MVLIGAAVALGAAACGMHHGKHMSETMMRKVALKHVGELMDDINADSGQRAEFTALTESIVNDAITLKKSHDADQKNLLAALKKDKVDRVAMHAKMDEHLSAFNGFLSKSLDKVLDAYEKLRPEQKQIVIDKLAAHMENN
jgi:Spy/CpxP family protein refolding chaperone